MTPAAASAAPVKQSSTEVFECQQCGHSFRRRTKAGIFSRCPKCSGRALGPTVKASVVAGATQRVQRSEEAKRKRAEAAKKKRVAAGTGAAETTQRGPQAPAASAPVPSATRTTVRTRTPAAPAPAQPSPVSSPGPVRSRAPASTPPQQVRPRGFLSRVFGEPDDDE